MSKDLEEVEKGHGGVREAVHKEGFQDPFEVVATPAGTRHTAEQMVNRSTTLSNSN